LHQSRLDYPDRIADDIISGRILPVPKGPTQTWVKCVSLFGDEESTWEVRGDGAFSMYNLPPGKYVLLVIQGTEVLKVVFHEFQSTVHPPLVINLKGLCPQCSTG
jgi:hypothetical protein